MKRLRVLLSAVLVLSILSLCIVQAFAAENNAGERHSRLDPTLEEIVAIIPEEENVDVSVWFRDVDVETKNEALYESLEQAKKDGIISDVDTYLEVGGFVETDKVYSLEEYQTYSVILRASRRNVFSDYNSRMLEHLTKKYEISPEIIYASVYTPSVEMSLHKEELVRIQYDDDVEIIYHYEEP